MRFLCVCQDGNVRSVAMAHRLHNKYGQEAIPLGWKRVSPETMSYFCHWADVIVPMQAEYVAHIPELFHPKIRVVDVGRDRFGAKIHPELAAMTIAACEAWKAEGLIT